MSEIHVSTAEQIADRKTQNARLHRFFVANPHVIYAQETLAEAAGCKVASVRTRISNLLLDGMNLVWHQTGYRDQAGQAHIESKRWEYVPRPAVPLGRDAGAFIPAPSAQSESLLDLPEIA